MQQQQGNVGAFLVRKPIAPSGSASPRLRGEQMADQLRGVLTEAAKECGPYRAPELFERIRPERTRKITLDTWLEGAIVVSETPTLMSPTWNRLMAVISGTFEVLVTVANGSLAQTWGDAQEVQGRGDAMQSRIIAAGDHVTLQQLNEAIVALDIEIDLDKQTRAHLVERKRLLLSAVRT